MCSACASFSFCFGFHEAPVAFNCLCVHRDICDVRIYKIERGRNNSSILFTQYDTTCNCFVLYARHLSDIIVVPGSMYLKIRADSVAMSLFFTGTRNEGLLAACPSDSD